MLEMQKRGSSIMSYNPQLEDMMDKSVQHSIDLIVTSPIQVSLLQSKYIYLYIYIFIYHTPAHYNIYQKVFKLHPYINSDCHR